MSVCKTIWNLWLHLGQNVESKGFFWRFSTSQRLSASWDSMIMEFCMCSVCVFLASEKMMIDSPVLGFLMCCSPAASRFILLLWEFNRGIPENKCRLRRWNHRQNQRQSNNKTNSKSLANKSNDIKNKFNNRIDSNSATISATKPATASTATSATASTTQSAPKSATTSTNQQQNQQHYRQQINKHSKSDNQERSLMIHSNLNTR